MSELTAKDLQWFRLANCNGNARFYEFKRRFLKRFAVQDGWDLQNIKKDCWTCDGTGMYSEDDPCRSCGGDGIYRVSEIWLQRWRLSDSIYHIPEFCSPPHHLRRETNSPRRTIEGIIKHGILTPHKDSPLWPDELVPVPEKVSHRCFLRLLLRHEPTTFYWLVINEIKGCASQHRAKLYFCLLRLRNKLDLFPAVEVDEVPF